MKQIKKEIKLWFETFCGVKWNVDAAELTSLKYVIVHNYGLCMLIRFKNLYHFIYIYIQVVSSLVLEIFN